MFFNPFSLENSRDTDIQTYTVAKTEQHKYFQAASVSEIKFLHRKEIN